MDVQDLAAAPASTEVTATPAVETQVQTTNVDPGAVAVETYTPTYKYKVRDKEFEFDDEIKPLIKSKDSESKWKRFFEKANGLDYVVQDKDQLSKQYQEYRKSNDPIVQQHILAKNHYDRGDYEMAFQALGIPEKVLMQHVLKKLQMQDMPAEQREAYNKATQAERENFTLKSQYEQKSQAMQDMLVQARVQQLDYALSQPEVSQIAQSFDQSQGPGAFKDAVIFAAQKHLASTGQDLSAQDAVEKVAKMFGHLKAQQQAQATQSNGAPAVVPVIPVAKGGSTSTVKKKMNSIADIEKEYASL